MSKNYAIELLKYKILKKEFNKKLFKRNNEEDAGIDIPIPLKSDFIIVKPGVTRIPLGISVEIPEGYMGILYPRSGSTTRGLISLQPPIDRGYSGEIHLILLNLNDDIVIHKDERLCQLVLVRIPDKIIDEEVNEIKSGNRGNKGFNSSGR